MLTLKEKRGTIVYLSVTSVILSKKKISFNLISLISSNTTDLDYDNCFQSIFRHISASSLSFNTCNLAKGLVITYCL